MLDPTIAEKLARLTKEIADNVDRTERGTANSVHRAIALQAIFNDLVGSTDKVSKNMNAMTTVLQKNAKHAQAIKESTSGTASATNKAGKAAQKHKDELEKSSVFARVLANTLKAIVTYILSDMVVALATLHNKGFAPTQVALQGWNALGSQFSLLLQGIPASLSSIASAQAELSAQLGGTNMFTSKMVENIAALNTMYGVSIATGSQITNMLYRWSNGSEAVTKNTVDFITSLAMAKGVAPGALLEEMAKNSQLMAQYGASGAKAFAESAIALMRMGVSMQSINSFSDKLVDDFQGTLAATAKIQTFLPGFNIAGVQFAAQFGTVGDVAKELQSALRGSGIKDLNQLPRSLRNALSSSLGMSQAEIENLLHPISATQKEAIGPITTQHFDSEMQKIANILLRIFGMLAGISGLLLGGNILKSVIEGKATSGGIVAHLMERGIGGLGIDAVKSIPATLKALPGNLKTLMVGKKAFNIEDAMLPEFKATSAESSVFKLGAGLAKGLVGIVGGFVLDWGAKKLAAGGHAGLAGTANIGSDVLTGAGIGILGGPIFAIAGAIVGGLIGLFKNGGAIWTAVKNFFSGKDVGAHLNNAAQSANIGNAFSAAGGHDLAFAQHALAQRTSTGILTAPMIAAGVTVADNKTTESKNAIAMDTSALEGKMDTFIDQLSRIGITVNLDGKKVGGGLMYSHRYGAAS